MLLINSSARGNVTDTNDRRRYDRMFYKLEVGFIPLKKH